MPHDRTSPIWRREVLPDPQNVLGFTLVVAAFLSHVWLVPGSGGRYLVAETLWLEAAFHVWLLVAPALGTYLGLRHVLERGESPLALFTLPFGALMTVLTAAGVVVGALA